MDDVDDLPTSSRDENTPQELAILQKYFAKQGGTQNSSSEFGIKESIYATILFIVLANPAVDHILDFIPHTGSPLIKAGIKAMIYFVLVYLIFIRM